MAVDSLRSHVSDGRQRQLAKNVSPGTEVMALRVDGKTPLKPVDSCDSYEHGSSLFPVSKLDGVIRRFFGKMMDMSDPFPRGDRERETCGTL